MTLTLPTDPETERLARKLADATGKPLPMIVKAAIEAEAAKAGVSPSTRPSRDALLAEMTRVTDQFADLPVLDSRSADEIIGYDELGLPQ
jgi:antitoxin VapB